MKNLSKVFLLCFIALFAFAAQSMGQGKTITGQVVDALNESMPGVNVQVKGTTNGTITNIDGKFSISVPNSKSVLVIVPLVVPFTCTLTPGILSFRASTT